MKIVTFNGAGKQNWQAALGLDPDILLFQEAPAPPPEIADRIERVPTRNKWGSAVYFKKGEFTPVKIQHDYDWLPGWLVGVDVENGSHPLGFAKKLRILSLHAPPQSVSGSNYPETVKQLLGVVAQNRGDGEIVLGGDFNLLSLAERHPEETKNDSSWEATRAEREIHKQLDELELMNCWQAKNPGMPLGRTLRYRSKESSSAFHCDGLFVPKTWQQDLVSADILETADWMARSDHNPVVATFSQTIA